MPATLNATTTSSSVAVPEFNSPRVFVVNDGPSDARGRVGATGLTALLTDPLIKVGNIVSLGTALGSAAFFAAITASGTATLRISSPGSGAQRNAGPTGAAG